MLMAQGLTSVIWGVSFFDNPEALKDYEQPYAIYVNWILLLFQHLGLFIVPALLFAVLVHPEPRLVLGLRPISPKIYFAGAAIMIAAMPLVNALAWVNELMALPSWLSGLEMALKEMEDQAQALTTMLAGQTDWRFLLINLVVMAVVPAIGEEMIFRGLILRIVETWSGKVHTAVWVSAIFFSGMHLQFYGFLPRLVLGALLGYLFVWSRSLWVPIIAHFTNNAVALILMFFIARGDISAEMDGFSPVMQDWILLGVSLVVVAVIAVFIKKTGKHKPTLKEV